MLREHDLPVGTFVRYVGNRIHILFHLAGILILHLDKVINFLQMHCTAAGLLRTKLPKDLGNEKILSQVWALAVVGKTFSGPWMTKFYSGHMSNLQMRPLVQSTERQLQAWIEMPQTLIHATENTFVETLSSSEDNVLSALHNFIGDVDLQMEALSAVLRASLAVLQRQLRLFLVEDRLPLEVENGVSSAPTHNMAAERTLGALDKMRRRAPVATGGFLNGKILSKMNKCSQWLDSQNSVDQEKMVNFAVSEARETRVKRRVLERALEKEVSRRRVEIANERKTKNNKKAIKSVAKAIKTKSVSDLDCSDSVKDKINSFIEEQDSLLDIAFTHTVDQSEFYGRIHSADIKNIVVGYWGLEETECSSVDHTLSTANFFGDAVLDLVVFL